MTLGSPLVRDLRAVRCRPVLATAWLATPAAAHAKNRPGITPCGLIRNCWFPSSVAVVTISGEQRKGSGLLRKQSAGRSAPAQGSPAKLDLGVDHGRPRTKSPIVRVI